MAAVSLTGAWAQGASIGDYAVLAAVALASLSVATTASNGSTSTSPDPGAPLQLGAEA